MQLGGGLRLRFPPFTGTQFKNKMASTSFNSLIWWLTLATILISNSSFCINSLFCSCVLFLSVCYVEEKKPHLTSARWGRSVQLGGVGHSKGFFVIMNLN